MRNKLKKTKQTMKSQANQGCSVGGTHSFRSQAAVDVEPAQPHLPACSAFVWMVTQVRPAWAHWRRPFTVRECGGRKKTAIGGWTCRMESTPRDGIHGGVPSTLLPSLRWVWAPRTQHTKPPSQTSSSASLAAVA